MHAEGLPEIFINNFAAYYEQLRAGETGLIPESTIEPVVELPDAEDFSPRLAKIGRSAFHQTAIIKLNGGLGTSMGMEQAKSLLKVKEGYTFLDIIAHQAIQAGVPLVLMNSFATEADSLALLSRYPELNDSIPLTFLQHKQPKISESDLSPASWPADPSLEWCPPGHGDIYIALQTSGMLQKLLDAGYHYAFVSNADNLGAVLDASLLGYFANSGAPFMMEVAERTAMDRKGGHLAQRPSGGGKRQLILRESAQCPAEDMAAFQDVTRHRYFNTNNLWLHLPALQRVLEERGGRLGLQLIRNLKTVDPRDKSSPLVYQLETAMGSAIAVFEGSQAVCVPRTRFAPVKKTDDLLAVQSDAYVLTGDFRVIPNPERRLGALLVELDPEYYQFISQFEERFPAGPPSLVHCRRLRVEGDYRFMDGVEVRGDVVLRNESGRRVIIPAGTMLEG
jgi:UTP--glucose-1-phosphate uridylyltransferase